MENFTFCAMIFYTAQQISNISFVKVLRENCTTLTQLGLTQVYIKSQKFNT